MRFQHRLTPLQTPIQTQKQVQKLRLSPKLIQMLRFCHYGYRDLHAAVQKELSDNVVLELARPDQLLAYTSRGPDTDSGPVSEAFPSHIADESSPDIVSHLVDQLDLQHLSEIDYLVIKRLIEHLDDRGYLTDYTAVKAHIKAKLGISDRKVGECLKILQQLDPDGVGARSLKECLLIQLEAHAFEDEFLMKTIKTVISSHLELLTPDTYPILAKKLGVSVTGIEAISAFIRENLAPNPGAQFTRFTPTQIVIPSYSVKKVDDQWVVTNLELKKGIQVQLSRSYMTMLSDPKLDNETKSFLMEKKKKADALIEMLANRQKQMDHFIQVIVSRQTLFLEKGKGFLMPLPQKEIAIETGLSASTISRLVSGKYIETPHGIILLHELCPRRYFGKTKTQHLAMLRSIFESNPSFSDHDCATYLKTQNIQIARRTVTKYRRLLGLKSSYTR